MVNNNGQTRLQHLAQRFNNERTTTYEHIIDTFKQLVMTKDFSKLSVAEISEQASISRKTFYRYFKDKNEIIEHIVYAEIMKPMEQIRSLTDSFEMPSLTVMSWLYEQLYKERQFYKRINSFTGQNSFFELMLAYTSQIVADKFASLNISAQEKEYSIYFYASSHVMVLSKWIDEGMQIPPAQMASFYEKWTIPAIADYIEQQR